jgi:integrase
MKTKTFLHSIGRNNHKTKHAYEVGLVHFNRFLKEKYPGYNVETILKLLLTNKIDVYELLDNFVSYLPNLTPNSVKFYISSLRSYLAYYDIDIIPSKFKRKVKLPKVYREDEEPLDVSDIRKILLSCNNRRLKAYLLVLASGGMRAVEALAIRIRDIDFSTSPTKIHVRKEYTKTKVARDIYISDEANQYLRQWINWKYRDKGEYTKVLSPDDLVFSIYSIMNEPNPNNLYIKIIIEFEKLLTIVGLDGKKEGMKRRKITLHSLRRFVKTVISDEAGQDYSEWFLGHNKSPYYTKKEIDRREIYATKCMKYLTFLDYTTLEATGKNIEAKLQEKDKQIHTLREKYDTDIELLKNAIADMQQLLKNPEKLTQIASNISNQEIFQ